MKKQKLLLFPPIFVLFFPNEGEMYQNGEFEASNQAIKDEEARIEKGE